MNDLPPTTGETTAAETAASDARDIAMKQALQRDVATWNADRTGTPERMAAPQEAAPKRAPARAKAKAAAVAPPPAAPTPPARKAPFSMSYDGLSSAAYNAARHARGLR